MRFLTAVLVLILLVSPTFAEKRTYIDKDILSYNLDGTTSNSTGPFCEMTFDIQKDKILVSGTILQDSNFYKKGQVFCKDWPFQVVDYKTLYNAVDKDAIYAVALYPKDLIGPEMLIITQKHYVKIHNNVDGGFEVIRGEIKK